MRSFTAASALMAATAFAGSASYWENGADWGNETPLCGNGKEQSPIDLGNWAHDNHEMSVSLNRDYNAS